jgi:Thiamine pyrophosphate enzyme, central domain
MTPQNAASETERLIAEALYHRRPVYLAIPSDVADKPVLAATTSPNPPTSDPESLAAATDAVSATLNCAGQACVLPGVLLRRLGPQGAVTDFVDASGLPYATMFGDKSVMSEDHPGYIGMYIGRLMNEPVRAFVEACDAVVLIDAMLTDGNTAGVHRPARPGQGDQHRPSPHHHRRHGLPERGNRRHPRATVGAHYPKPSATGCLTRFTRADFQQRQRPDHRRCPLSALGELLSAQRCDHDRHRNIVAGVGARPPAHRSGVSQPDAVGVDRMGDSGGVRRRGRRSRASTDLDHWRRFAPDDRAGDQPIRSAWAAPDCVRAQQLRLSQRAAPVQGHGHRLQRRRGVELRRASARRGVGAGSPRV